MEEKQLTSIQITVEFRDWLQDQGKKGETYEDIIKRLIPTWGNGKPAS